MINPNPPLNDSSDTHLIPSQDEANKKAAATYMAENADMPPPRYQMDGTLPTMHSGGGGGMGGSSAINPGKFLLSKASHVAVDDAEEHSNSCYYSVAYTRTLPHPKHQQMHHQIVPPRDDSMIGKNGYLPAPSPAPPMDGSYYNMNSDRYLSYPPMVSLHFWFCRNNFANPA